MTMVPSTGDVVTVKVSNVNPRAAKVGNNSELYIFVQIEWLMTQLNKKLIDQLFYRFFEFVTFHFSQINILYFH